MLTELVGHTSPDTAYVVDDYPYGFRLRTTIRYWIETKPGHGQRVMSQTRDPKRAGEPWNKPKGSTYSPIKVLLLDSDTGHVSNAALSGYADETAIRAFQAAYPLTTADARISKTIAILIAMQRAHKRVTYRIAGPDEPRQDAATQNEILRKLTAIEYAKLQNEPQS